MNNVRMTRKRGVIHFSVPLNHPVAHNIGLSELLEAVERREKLDLFTGLNKKTGNPKENPVVREPDAPKTETEISPLEAESFRTTEALTRGAAWNPTSSSSERGCLQGRLARGRVRRGLDGTSFPDSGTST